MSACNGSSVTFDATPVENVSNVTYMWSTGEMTPTITTTIFGDYTVTVTADGCSITETVSFTEETNCIIPQAISPNGDNVNDSFDISFLDVENLKIFNRQGLLVYEKNDYTNEWFGQSKNDKELESFYSENISGIVVDNSGKIIKDVDANGVNPRKQFKTKDASQKQLPVFIYADQSGEKTYILPLYGLGLWDEIWGFIAVGSDGNTVKGIVLDHKGETPGLGARITEPEVQARFAGK